MVEEVIPAQGRWSCSWGMPPWSGMVVVIHDSSGMADARGGARVCVGIPTGPGALPGLVRGELPYKMGYLEKPAVRPATS